LAGKGEKASLRNSGVKSLKKKRSYYETTQKNNFLF
jgi:hypothetical protein